MDTLIRNGDYFKDENGSLVTVSGEDETLQRILFCLSTQKGSFNFDRELGSKFYMLGEYEREKLNDIAYEFAIEALIEIEGVSVKSAEVSVDDDKYSIELAVYMKDRKRLVKIRI